MPNFQIVTDSCAHFGAGIVPDNVTVVPNTLIIGGHSYREGVDISDEGACALMAAVPDVPTVLSPSVSDYAAVYERLARDCDGIISIHASREMFDSWSHAQVAAQPYTGRCRVIPIDSQNLSTAQAMLVRLTAQAAAQQPTLDDLVRIARGAVDQLYTVFTVDSVEYVMHHRILPPSQSILGAMLNIKPVLSMEHGRLIAIEKVRTRAQAIERLVEFVMEFTEVIDAAIMQPTTGLTEQGKLLQERLLVDFPGMSFIHTRYGASLAAFIGLDAIGLTVMENPNTRIDHDDY